MKIALLAAAATLAVASTAAAQSPGSWTGFYVGGSFGGAFNSSSNDETVLFDRNQDGQFGDTVLTAAGVNAFSPGFCGGAAQGATPASGCKSDKDGFSYAVHGGYDWQKPGTPYVFGVVGEIGRANVTDAVAAFSTTPAFYTLQRKEDYHASISGRAGRTFYANRTLVYATAGVAFARVKNSFSTSNTANLFTDTGNESGLGYKVGVGVEHRITPHISIGLQYAYSSTEADEYSVRAGNTGTTPATNPFLLGSAAGTTFQRSESDFANHNISASLSYRF